MEAIGFILGLVFYIASFLYAEKISGKANPLGVLIVLCRRTKWLRWAARGDDWYYDKLDAEMRKRSNV
jgi:hypothetical protein